MGPTALLWALWPYCAVPHLIILYLGLQALLRGSELIILYLGLQALLGLPGPTGPASPGRHN